MQISSNMFLDGTKYVYLYVFDIISVTPFLHFSYLLGLWMLICYTFWESWHAFGGEVRPGSEQSGKRDNNIKKGDKKRAFSQECYVFAMCFFVDFRRSLGKCCFRVLVAEVSQMGRFSNHGAAKLGSWKLVFRLHHTLLFKVLRGWNRTSRTTFSNIFSGMGFEIVLYYFFEKLRVQP